MKYTLLSVTALQNYPPHSNALFKIMTFIMKLLIKTKPSIIRDKTGIRNWIHIGKNILLSLFENNISQRLKSFLLFSMQVGKCLEGKMIDYELGTWTRACQSWNLIWDGDIFGLIRIYILIALWELREAGIEEGDGKEEDKGWCGSNGGGPRSGFPMLLMVAY